MAFTPLHSTDDIPLWTIDGEPILLWDERDVLERLMAVALDPRSVTVLADRSLTVAPVSQRVIKVGDDGRVMVIRDSRTFLALPVTV